MRLPLIRMGSGLVTLALLAGAPAMAVEASVLPPSTAEAMAQAASPQAIAEYRRKLKEHEQARAAFEAEAGAYWSAVSEKRKGRNAKRRERQTIALDDYVLTQPPVYSGPKRPVSPEPEEEKPPRERKPIPVVADFLKAAADHFQFVPQRPSSEVEFKRAYARYALASGLTREQAVRVYSFETGGTGNHDMQSGLSASRPGSRAISTAIGYNQLLTTNSVELMAEQGHEFIKELTAKAATLSGAPRKAMDHKLTVLKKMVAFSRTVPDTWSEHEKLANTPQGWAVHAMVLDIDVGPMLQTHKLLTSVIFARAKGYNRPLSAAELEMMNLTGDGTGLDMVTMPQAMRERVPTSNFFQRGGYERNPVAIRHNTVAKLLAVTDERMDFNSAKPGAKELAGRFSRATTPKPSCPAKAGHPVIGATGVKESRRRRGVLDRPPEPVIGRPFADPLADDDTLPGGNNPSLAPEHELAVALQIGAGAHIELPVLADEEQCPLRYLLGAFQQRSGIVGAHLVGQRLAVLAVGIGHVLLQLPGCRRRTLRECAGRKPCQEGHRQNRL